MSTFGARGWHLDDGAKWCCSPRQGWQKVKLPGPCPLHHHHSPVNPRVCEKTEQELQVGDLGCAGSFSCICKSVIIQKLIRIIKHYRNDLTSEGKRICRLAELRGEPKPASDPFHDYQVHLARSIVGASLSAGLETVSGVEVRKSVGARPNLPQARSDTGPGFPTRSWDECARMSVCPTNLQTLRVSSNSNQPPGLSAGLFFLCHQDLVPGRQWNVWRM